MARDRAAELHGKETDGGPQHSFVLSGEQDRSQPGALQGWCGCPSNTGDPSALSGCLSKHSGAQRCPAVPVCHRGQRAALKLGVVSAYATSDLLSLTLSLCCIEERARRDVGTIEP